MLNYTTSLPSAPINTPQQQQQAMANFAPHQYSFPSGMQPGTQVGPAAQNQLAAQLSGLTNNLNQGNAVQFGRQYNQMNNPWMLQQQVAQNNMGQQGINTAQGLQQQNFGMMGQQRNMLLDFLNGQGVLGGLV